VSLVLRFLVLTGNLLQLLKPEFPLVFQRPGHHPVVRVRAVFGLQEEAVGEAAQRRRQPPWHKTGHQRADQFRVESQRLNAAVRQLFIQQQQGLAQLGGQLGQCPLQKRHLLGNLGSGLGWTNETNVTVDECTTTRRKGKKITQ